jgi:glutamyl-tRNA synthetase
MSVVTRFAPSPTGFLHIGGARTALFNWLFTRHHGGTFRLRIEDTDRARSTQAAIDAILDGLRWLGIDWDGEVVFQFARADRHAEVARQMVAQGNAYYCYATPEELAEMREQARREGRPIRYDGRWRDRDPSEAPPGAAGAIRLKAPREGETVIHDLVQGEVRVANEQLDDMVLLRADGTPTYMLSVVVDDHDMNITHVIRGDDHLNNAFRQAQVFKAMGWPLPAFAHIPLIHGADGAKLSKRHGALGVDAYRDMGFLPEAMRNYLLRLGWGHGDVEIVGTEEAVRLFDISGVGRSPARFDMAKLLNVNGHYLREADNERLLLLLQPRLEALLGKPLDDAGRDRLRRGMDGLKTRAKTLVELAENAAFYVRPRPIPLDEGARRLLDEQARAELAGLRGELAASADWSEEAVEQTVRGFADRRGLKLGKVAQPLRAALTGSSTSPGLFEVMAVLGRDETLGRLADVAKPEPRAA